MVDSLAKNEEPKVLEMTLARALTYKKRVVERIAQVDNDIRLSNSVQVGTDRESDVQKLMDERGVLVDHLIDLKTLIARNNAPIQQYIFALAEFKGEIAFLKGISTFHGAKRESRGYGEPAETVQYEAVVRKVDVDRSVRELNTKIDAVQERLENHNHTTKITIKDVGLNDQS